MIIRRLKDCAKFISGDHAVLRELLHADKGDFAFRYSLAHAVVKPAHVTLAHRLKTSEVYYIISGRGLMHIGDKTIKVEKDSAVYIPPRQIQYIENHGRNDLVFLCIVDPAWKSEDEEIIKSQKVKVKSKK